MHPWFQEDLPSEQEVHEEFAIRGEKVQKIMKEERDTKAKEKDDLRHYRTVE